jgi:endonuclease/exonuclease/phosphatase family metal-dependent hydrolase
MTRAFTASWLVLLLISPLIGAQSDDAFSSDLRVITFNIRYNNPADGEHAWPNRKEQVASVIRYHQADLLGMQEVLRGQVDDLVAELPEYSWLGVGRDDGENRGEFSPIFYRTDRFGLRDSGTFWLSETPEVIASKSWDAALTRIATWARLTDLSTGTNFLFLNTHFDHRGEQARTHSAALIVERVKQLAGDEPIIVTGDFNVPPTTEAYAVMTSELKDSRLQSKTEPHGPQGTFGGFVVGATPNTNRIDYIFVSDSITVTRHGVLSDQIDGSYPSDHLPVLSEIRL